MARAFVFLVYFLSALPTNLIWAQGKSALSAAPGQQEGHRITGVVIEAITKKPIRSASVGLQKQSTSGETNNSGLFLVLGLESIYQDTLVVQQQGYQTGKLLITRDNAQKIVVELHKQVVQSRNSNTTQTNCSLFGYSNDSTAELSILPDTQYAFFINNNKHQQRRKLRSVSFYIAANGLPMAAFRIRVYKPDGKNYSPNTSLFGEYVSLTGLQGGEWYTWDLSRHNVVTPKEGYFVALEFGESADALSQVGIASYVPSGQIMRPSFDFKKSSIWSYSPAKGWALLPQSASLRRYNAMVKVEAEAVE